MPRETKRTLRLECTLTPEQLIEYSRKMVQARQSRIEAESNLKAVSQQIKAEIAEHEAQEGKYILQIQTGKEWKETECHVVYDFEAGHKLIVRNDTDTVIRTEPISDSERQEELKLQEEAAAKQTSETDQPDDLPELQGEDDGAKEEAEQEMAA